MKKTGLIAVLLGGVIVIGLAFALWPRTLRGEHHTERGSIYYFRDGVVAIDTGLSPNEFYIYVNCPGDKKIELVEIIDNGLQITGPGIEPGAEDFAGGKLSVGYTQQPQPGKIRVFENHGDWSEGRYIHISPKTIREFIGRRDWDASVRQLLEEKSADERIEANS